MAASVSNNQMVSHISTRWRSLMNGSMDLCGQRGTHPNFRNTLGSGMVHCSVCDLGDPDLLNAVLDMGYDVNAQSDAAFQSWPNWLKVKTCGAIRARFIDTTLLPAGRPGWPPGPGAA